MRTKNHRKIELITQPQMRANNHPKTSTISTTIVPTTTPVTSTISTTIVSTTTPVTSITTTIAKTTRAKRIRTVRRRTMRMTTACTTTINLKKLYPTKKKSASWLKPVAILTLISTVLFGSYIF